MAIRDGVGQVSILLSTLRSKRFPHIFLTASSNRSPSYPTYGLISATSGPGGTGGVMGVPARAAKPGASAYQPANVPFILSYPYSDGL